MLLTDWARAYSSVPPDRESELGSATIRHSPADFDVTEMLGFDLDGSGEHDYVYIEKTCNNTEWVARQLAGFAKVPAKDVGYSGLKDRNAVTRQWFSVPRWNSPEWTQLCIDGVSIQEVGRHSRKLRRGAHRSNHFKIVLRDFRNEFKTNPDSIHERLRLIERGGVPNYFGPQRFGRGGANVNLADAWSAGARLPRHKRSLAISSARSLLFNDALHVRVLNGTWNQLLEDDVANLDGTGSVFDVDDIDATLIARCKAMDIHPSGVLWGDGSDTDLVSDAHPAWLAALSKARVKPAHRSLRLRVQNLRWYEAEDSITLEFSLGRGAFATSVLREIANVNDAPASTADQVRSSKT